MSEYSDGCPGTVLSLCGVSGGEGGIATAGSCACAPPFAFTCAFIFTLEVEAPPESNDGGGAMSVVGSSIIHPLSERWSRFRTRLEGCSMRESTGKLGTDMRDFDFDLPEALVGVGV